ncbi:Prostatic acid phosphatase, partial [Operophtera brumata]
ADELSLSDQQEKIKNMTYIEGLEGLTNVGKQKGYHMGKFYKQRYGQQGFRLVSDLYLRDEIAIRSTDKERTKMMIQMAMAAAYPPETEQQWDENLGKVWQPVPYTAVPLTEDYLRYYSNCNKFTALMEEEKRAALSEEFKPYDDLIPLLKQKTGRNFTEDPLLFQVFYDLLKSTVSEPDDIMSGKPVTQRLKLYSAHDYNVGALMMVSKVRSNNSIPEYGSVYALELYKSKRGEYTVVPIYLPAAGSSSVEELQIIGCEHSRCDYVKFRDLTKEYRLAESDFYNICKIRTEM